MSKIFCFMMLVLHKCCCLSFKYWDFVDKWKWIILWMTPYYKHGVHGDPIICLQYVTVEIELQLVVNTTTIR